ncbi:MAG: hypothetical protein Q4F78_07955 [Bacillota bacterium]|nr:hypothetical protein [Bacillota bacterium]
MLKRLEYRIETEEEVKTYLARLRYAIESGADIIFQEKRGVDDKRALKYTNRYTVATLFPDENPVDVLKRELMTLTSKDYLRTVKDTRFPNRSEMREFGKTYDSDEVYIKIRVELASALGTGGHITFVMSFHFAEVSFCEEVFPYK